MLTPASMSRTLPSTGCSNAGAVAARRLARPVMVAVSAIGPFVVFGSGSQASVTSPTALTGGPGGSGRAMMDSSGARRSISASMPSRGMPKRSMPIRRTVSAVMLSEPTVSVPERSG